MVKKIDSNIARKRRQKRVRGKIHGTAERPRLNVYRSNKNIYAQIIDDKAGVTLVSVCSLQNEFSDNFGGNIEAAKNIGIKIAKLAVDKGITEVVFDRGGYLYHGRVKAIADGAREGGLSF